MARAVRTLKKKMFEDIIPPKYYRCLGCDKKIEVGKVCPTCNLGGHPPREPKEETNGQQ